MKYLSYYCVVGTQAFLKGYFSSLKYMVPPLSFGDSHKGLGLPSYKKTSSISKSFDRLPYILQVAHLPHPYFTQSLYCISIRNIILIKFEGHLKFKKYFQEFKRKKTNKNTD